MKKSLKVVLLALVLVPCMVLLTACGGSISLKEFSSLQFNSAKNFLAEYGTSFGHELTVIQKEESLTESHRSVSYQQSESLTLSETKPFETLYKTTTTISVQGYNSKILVQEETIENGWRGVDYVGFEEYTTRSVEETEYIIYQESDEYGNAESQQMFVRETVKEYEDGELTTDTETKEVYNYTLTADEYYNDSKTVTDRIKSIATSTFYNAEILDMVLFTGEFFEDGNVFGFELDLATTSVDSDDNNVTKMEQTARVEMTSRGPKSYTADMAMVLASELSSDDSKYTATQSCTFAYSASTISAPTGYTETTTKPNINF